MKIELTSSNKKTFATLNSWEDANQATKAIFKRNFWSDLYYKITFEDGTIAKGVIDLEPQSFHKPHQNSILLTHCKTYWTNVSKTTPKPYLLQCDIDYFKKLLKYLPI